MGNQFARGAKAISTCDRCGQVFLLKELKHVTIKLKRTQIKVCDQCWETDHPQWQIGMYPVSDPQALREPRPDQSLHQIRSIPVVIYIGPGAAAELGRVQVTGDANMQAISLPMVMSLGVVSHQTDQNISVSMGPMTGVLGAPVVNPPMPTGVSGTGVLGLPQITGDAAVFGGGWGFGAWGQTSWGGVEYTSSGWGSNSWGAGSWGLYKVGVEGTAALGAVTVTTV